MGEEGSSPGAVERELAAEGEEEAVMFIRTRYRCRERGAPWAQLSLQVRVNVLKVKVYLTV